MLKPDQSPTPPPTQFLCQLSNISQCLEIEGQERVTYTPLLLFFFLFLLCFQFTLTLWNPTIHPVVHHVRVPVNTDYTVHDPTGAMVVAEVKDI